MPRPRPTPPASSRRPAGRPSGGLSDRAAAPPATPPGGAPGGTPGPAGARAGLLLGALLGAAPGAALGIGRFAYALVLPDMRAALDLSLAQAGALGSANTAGYLLGALVSHRALEALGYRRGFVLALLAQVAVLAGTGATGAVALLAALRFAQGALGALVFVGGAALLLASGGRGLATGVYFGGVGLGILLSPLVLPFADGWRAAWLLLAGLSGLLALPVAWAAPRLREPAARRRGDPAGLGPIGLLLVSYGLYGAGYIGYMTFVTGDLPVAMGPFWAILGAAACFTGVAWGPASDALGGRATMRLVLLALALGSLPPLVTAFPYVSAALFGVSFLGVITALTDAFRRLLPPSAWGRAMGLSTAAFATGQALGPWLAGTAGEAVGRADGALWAATALLLAALALALPRGPRRAGR